MKKLIPIVVVIVVIAFVCFISYKAVTADQIGSVITVTNTDGSQSQKVFVAASSNIYEYWDSSSSAGVFLDIFNDVKQEGETLAGAIDKGFPYSIEFVASTATSDSTRYLIQTPSGSTYWVEP